MPFVGWLIEKKESIISTTTTTKKTLPKKRKMANWTNTLDTIEPETISETFTTDNTTTGLTGSKKRTFKKKLPYNIIPKKSIKRHLWLIPFINGIIIIFTSFVPYVFSIDSVE